MTGNEEQFTHLYNCVSFLKVDYVKIKLNANNLNLIITVNFYSQKTTKTFQIIRFFNETQEDYEQTFDLFFSIFKEFLIDD